MTLHQLIDILVMIMLVQMMLTIGMGVTVAELLAIAKNWPLVLRAGLANYVCIPAVTLVLLIVVHADDPNVPAGFLILAVCPGAPFGPPCTRIAKGDVAAAVGLMVILAGSSALAAPVLLHFLMPLVSPNESLQVDAVKIVNTLLLTQLFPLCVGLCLRRWWPGPVQRLQRLANIAGAALGLLTIGLILVVDFPLLKEIRLRGYGGMSALLIASWVVGWLLGGPGHDSRKAMTLTTSLRNVGVGLVIAGSNFPGTAAVTAALAYGLLEILGSVLLAVWWGRQARAKELGSP
jgi:BASS family bile acid:Na+ symporter